MPNSPIRRFESCYMPPKKFAWRFDNINPSESNTDSLQKTENSTKVNAENQKMGPLFDDEMKSNPTTEEPSLAERPVSPAMQSSNEDAPLDFSVRNHNRVSSNGPSNKAVTDSEFKYSINFNSCSDYLKRLHSMSSVAFPIMYNGRNSPPPPSNDYPGNRFPNGNAWDNTESHNGNQSSPKMDCSEIPNEHPTSINEKTELNGGKDFYKRSPKHQSLSRENGPINGCSILQGMLKSRKHESVNKMSSSMQNVNINGHESLQRENIAELVNARSPVMTTANQHILPPFISPVNNLMPLPLGSFPFLGGMSYMGPPVGSLSGGILSQASEASVLQALTQRKPRRRKSEDRPFKSYPIEVLDEKLQNVSTSAFAFGLEYSKKVMCNALASRSPPSDLGGSAPMNESLEHVNGAINSNTARATNGTNNPPSAHGSGDSNDSSQGARPETAEATSCTDGRKRRSTADVDKDDAYWDRRRKNNLAAKRSREARRRKEDAIANMAVIYETQNVELQQHVGNLNFKLNETSAQLSRLLREHENLTIQNKILQERLSQKRCGQCGAQLPNVH